MSNASKQLSHGVEMSKNANNSERTGDSLAVLWHREPINTWIHPTFHNSSSLTCKPQASVRHEQRKQWHVFCDVREKKLFNEFYGKWFFLAIRSHNFVPYWTAGVQFSSPQTRRGLTAFFSCRLEEPLSIGRPPFSLKIESHDMRQLLKTGYLKPTYVL